MFIKKAYISPCVFNFIFTLYNYIHKVILGVCSVALDKILKICYSIAKLEDR